MDWIMESGQANAGIMRGGCPTLNASHEQPIYISTDKKNPSITEDGVGTTLTAAEEDRPMVAHSNVRRLTPLECERLQDYPDGWTLIGEPEEVEVKDYATMYVAGENCQFSSLAEAIRAWYEEESDTEQGSEDDEEIEYFNPKEYGFIEKKICIGSHKEIEYFYLDEKGKKKRCSDSQRYRALGNSIALPYWQHLARRICAQYERDITMASLFDGISGFPLVFARCGAKPVWASEIEPFPVAVCKAHFGDEATGEKGDLWKFLSL